MGHWTPTGIEPRAYDDDEKNWTGHIMRGDFLQKDNGVEEEDLNRS